MATLRLATESNKQLSNQNIITVMHGLVHDGHAQKSFHVENDSSAEARRQLSFHDHI